MTPLTGLPEAPTIRVLVLYPEVMDVYADRGNLIALRARCRTLGVGIEVTSLDLGDPLPEAVDLILIGGGQDREQHRVAADLHARGVRIREWIEEGTAALAVCGGFQLFGHAYHTAAGEELTGIAVFDVTTVAPGPGWPRCIGDVLARATDPEVGEVVGFENHGGRTYLGPAAQPFARIEYGHGNNGDDRTEGAVYREAVGTYLHGSVLPKNPALTDRLIRAALRHRYGVASKALALPTVEDPWAARAHHVAAATARKRARAWEA